MEVKIYAESSPFIAQTTIKATVRHNGFTAVVEAGIDDDMLYQTDSLTPKLCIADRLGRQAFGMFVKGNVVKHTEYDFFNRICDEIYKVLKYQSYNPAASMLDFAADSVMKPVHNNAATELSKLAKALPGVNEETSYPCKCVTSEVLKQPLMNVVIHLNDKHNDWDRNRIADWIESLDIDTEFK